MKNKLKKRNRINLSLNEKFDDEEGHYQILNEIEIEECANNSYMGEGQGFRYYDGDIRDSNWYFFRKNINHLYEFNKELFLENNPTFEEMHNTDYLFTTFIPVNKKKLNFNNELLKKIVDFDFDLFEGFINVLFSYRKKNWNNFEEPINFKIAFNIKEKQFILTEFDNDINCYLFNEYVKYKKVNYLVVEHKDQIKNNLSILKMLDY